MTRKIDYSDYVNIEQLANLLIGCTVVEVGRDDEECPSDIGIRLVFDDGSRLMVGYSGQEGSLILEINRDA